MAIDEAPEQGFGRFAFGISANRAEKIGVRFEMGREAPLMNFGALSPTEIFLASIAVSMHSAQALSGIEIVPENAPGPPDSEDRTPFVRRDLPGWPSGAAARAYAR